MKPLVFYSLKRLALIPISLAVLATGAFALVSMIPGNPGATILGDFATPTDIARIDHALGVDRPFLSRYWLYMSHLLHGHLGSSFYTNQPVLNQLLGFLPNTIELVVAALLVALVIGSTVGAAAAYFRRRLPDRLARFFIGVAQAVPDFVLGLVLIFCFFHLLNLAPAPTGRLAPTEQEPRTITHFLIVDCILSGKFGLLWSALSHLVLPALTLGLVYSAYFAKTVRATMASALGSAQVEFARACGLSERRVVYYAFLESRTAVMTYFAVLFGSLLGGEAIVEIVFSWPGAGQWALQSMLKNDVPVVEGFILAVGLVTLISYVVLDVAVAALDPRVSRG
ncbi:MAG TPA: ABC transporter permease [Gaiellaceae bacterium]|jgi:peptide/nickel transport system permease protein|nr:ABC transporter permease [Gaiellaceae bacterium]